VFDLLLHFCLETWLLLVKEGIILFFVKHIITLIPVKFFFRILAVSLIITIIFYYCVVKIIVMIVDIYIMRWKILSVKFFQINNLTFVLLLILFFIIIVCIVKLVVYFFYHIETISIWIIHLLYYLFLILWYIKLFHSSIKWLICCWILLICLCFYLNL
jgi:hypothetical protein